VTRGVLAKKAFCAPTFVARQPTHSLPQENREGSVVLDVVRVCEQVRRLVRALAAEINLNVAV
jgi:hypothetical protein